MEAVVETPTEVVAVVETPTEVVAAVAVEETPAE